MFCFFCNPFLIKKDLEIFELTNQKCIYLHLKNYKPFIFLLSSLTVPKDSLRRIPFWKQCLEHVLQLLSAENWKEIEKKAGIMSHWRASTDFDALVRHFQLPCFCVLQWGWAVGRYMLLVYCFCYLSMYLINCWYTQHNWVNTSTLPRHYLAVLEVFLSTTKSVS